MKETTLALRLSRRAIAAAVLDADELTFIDGRHLTSRKDRALAAAERYLRRILELTTPTEIVIDAPAKETSTTNALLQTALAVAKAAGATPRMIGTGDVLQAYGIPAVPSRIELRKIVARLWPQLATMTSAVKPYVLDAAALTLHAQAEHALAAVPT